MVNLVNALTNQRAKSRKRSTSQWIRDLTQRGLRPIIALLLAALALIALALLRGTEPTGTEFLIGP
jgi:hypothetical protein